MTPDTFPSRSTRLVMDVGGSHVTAARVDVTAGDAAIVARRGAELDSQGSGDEILRTILRVASPLSDGGESWSVAMPGPFDYERGVGTFEGIGKFAGIAGLDLRSALAPGLRTRADDIEFLNDAAAFGIGEWAHAEDGERPRRLVCLTLGTGVGSVFLDGGVPVTSGPEVPRDGFAHTIEFAGRPLEETVSTRAIKHAYEESTHIVVEVAEIAARATRGDLAALEAFAGPMRSLGQAVGPWVTRFGATRLVIGGAMSRSWDLLSGPLRSGLSESADLRNLRVLPSRLGDDAQLFGAATWSLRGVDPAAPRSTRQ